MNAIEISKDPEAGAKPPLTNFLNSSYDLRSVTDILAFVVEKRRGEDRRLLEARRGEK
jgi:hypothetical protein